MHTIIENYKYSEGLVYLINLRLLNNGFLFFLIHNLESFIRYGQLNDIYIVIGMV